MLVAAAILQASAATFAPPLGVPLRITSERVEGGERRYAMERLVRFAREPGGYRAELVLLEATGDANEASAAMFEGGFAAIAGRVIVLHLDPVGKVLSIDDMAALWERFCARVAEMAAARRSLSPADRAKLAERIATPLRALPPGRQRQMLSSFVTSLVSDEAGEPIGIRPVRVPGASPFGGPVMLEGSRNVTALPGGLVRSITHAAADMKAPAEGGSGHVELDRTSDIDPRTGLIVASTTTTRTLSRTPADTRETVRVTTLKVTIAPPDSWPVS